MVTGPAPAAGMPAAVEPTRPPTASTTVAGWAPLRPPFRALRPGLVQAEEHLNATGSPAWGPRWRLLADAMGDPAGCTLALNTILADLGITLGLADTGGRWRVVLTNTRHVSTDEIRAAHAVALLVEADGWNRLKRCCHRSCLRTFLDATNAGTRTRCQLHTRPKRTQR